MTIRDQAAQPSPHPAWLPVELKDLSLGDLVELQVPLADDFRSSAPGSIAMVRFVLQDGDGYVVGYLNRSGQVGKWRASSHCRDFAPGSGWFKVLCIADAPR